MEIKGCSVWAVEVKGGEEQRQGERGRWMLSRSRQGERGKWR